MLDTGFEPPIRKVLFKVRPDRHTTMTRYSDKRVKVYRNQLTRFVPFAQRHLAEYRPRIRPAVYEECILSICQEPRFVCCSQRVRIAHFHNALDVGTSAACD